MRRIRNHNDTAVFAVSLGLLAVLLFTGCGAKYGYYGSMDKAEENPSPKEDVNETEAQDAPFSEEAASPDSAVMKEESEAVISQERYTYQPDFYSEPITEEVKNRIDGISYPEGCGVPYEDLRYLSVLYTDFDHKTQTGELICSKEIDRDLLEIFYELYQAEYPIEQICLIDEYGGDDVLSMMDNNSSCFNYRVIAGSSKLSNHALGRAVDINPFFNPYVKERDGVLSVSPETASYYADRNRDFFGKIDHDDLCYQAFVDHGFEWGGDWPSLKDYQHFEKNP